MRLVLHALTLVFIQVGIYAWYQLADFDKEFWVTRYYLWDKGVMVLLFLCCVFPVKTLIPFWVVIGMFFVLRLLLEISYLTPYVGIINNFLTQYRIMFLINLICTFIIASKALKKPL